MPPSSGELWGHHLMPSTIQVDCLLPTGIIIQVDVSRDETLERIKADLWVKAKLYPLYERLLEPASYIFVSITQDARKEEFYDETRRFCDLRLFQPILKIVEPVGNREEKMLNFEIGVTIGVSINEFNEMKDLEVMTFRRNILDICKNAIEDRQRRGKASEALYAYPPDIESSPILPSHLQTKIKEMKNDVVACVWVVSEDNSRSKFSVKVPHDAYPIDVIAGTIRRRSRMMGISKEHAERCIEEYSDTYALKVCGCDQFLLEEHPLSQYKYVRECIARDNIPQFMLLTKESLYAAISPNVFITPSYTQKGMQLLTEINQQKTLSLWEIHAKLRIKILCATYVNVKELGKIYVKAGIYHGTEALCEFQDTKLVDSNNPQWHEWLEFLYIQDLPRSAKLCLSICYTSKKRREPLSLGWANLQLFDFNDRLMNEKVSLNLWPLPQGMDDLLNYVGLPGSNPDQETPCLEIEFDRLSHPVSYPPEKQIEDLALYAIGKESPLIYLDTPQIQTKERAMVDDITSRDPLSEISEQEKDILWKLREYCIKVPQSLPKLLQSVKWNEREYVAQLYMLLRRWPRLMPEFAMELLDCSYPDLCVRQYAVTCLDHGFSDDKLQQYMLQLVQALKFEPYLDSPITRFLLKRALQNQKTGQLFFWHLKSEIHNTSIQLRFGLVLEAFCRGCGSNLKMLLRQVEALDKLTKLTNMIKNEVKDDINEIMKFLANQLQQPDYQDGLKNFLSPLDNSHILGDLDISHCSVMTSKKKPLWLVFSNPDVMADIWFTDYKLIFKNGDDLRQDMLTVQLFKIMDTLWKNEGLDLRLIPYSVISTGKDVGVIEIVRDSSTIMSIQQKNGIRAAVQMDSLGLYNWIMYHNKDREEQAISNFTRSCAGYCVATFILGIKDRHSGNIMVRKNGQVFHIDFGHFLDHRKKKFGITRERVPFVLTMDFIRVIARGSDQPLKHKEFKKFQQLCCEAYLIIRKNAYLFINLMTMMLSCGIPELQSLDDISYLRKTLAVEEKDDEKALKYFIAKFNSAYSDAWTVKTDWLFHYMKNR